MIHCPRWPSLWPFGFGSFLVLCVLKLYFNSIFRSKNLILLSIHYIFGACLVSEEPYNFPTARQKYRCPCHQNDKTLNSWQQSRTLCGSLRLVIKSNDIRVAHNKRFICFNLTARVEIKYLRSFDNSSSSPLKTFSSSCRYVATRAAMLMSFSSPATWWTDSSVKSTLVRDNFR